jgi:hypothetical protein
MSKVKVLKVRVVPGEAYLLACRAIFLPCADVAFLVYAV